MAFLLAACADDPTDDNRQFANDPVATGSSEATSVVEPDVPGDTPQATKTEPKRNLLETRGAPDTVFVLQGGAVVGLTPPTSQVSNRIPTDPETVNIDLAQSPSGDRVAVLAAAPSALQVTVYDASGKVIERVSNLGPAPVATPRAVDAMSTSAITWSASGDRLLVVIDGGSIESIQIGGERTTVELPERLGQIESAQWSPQGTMVAILARQANGLGIIWTIDGSFEADTLIRIAPPNADALGLGSVLSFQWMPDGTEIAYILAAETESNPEGGQLYVTNLKTGNRRILASSGRGGPAALISSFSVSPDGKSVAYVIVAPNGRRWQYDSVWLRASRSPSVERLLTEPGVAVTRVWWIEGGVVLEQATEGSAVYAFLAPDSTPVILGQGTPVSSGSPMPLASPVGGTPASSTLSDHATPQAPLGFASPEASPVPSSPESSPAD